jgi:RNA polymerase sigma-70 factor (ECF subfamily)
MPTTTVMVNALTGIRNDPGGPEYFWQLVERFRADLVHQAYVIVGNQHDAEDTAQETLSQAFLRLDELRDPSKLGAWLRGINRYNALSLRRKSKHDSKREIHIPTGELVSLEDKDADEPVSDDALIRAVDELPDPYRDVVILRYVEKLSTDEIAVRLGVPSGTVRGQLTRADGMLAKKLKLIQTAEDHPR